MVLPLRQIKINFIQLHIVLFLGYRNQLPVLITLPRNILADPPLFRQHLLLLNCLRINFPLRYLNPRHYLPLQIDLPILPGDRIQVLIMLRIL